MGTWQLWGNRPRRPDCRTQARAWKLPITVAGFRIIRCSLGSVEQPWFPVSSCNVASACRRTNKCEISPLIWKELQEAFFDRFFSPLSLALLTPTVCVIQVVKDPVRGRFGAETNSWQHGEPLGSRVRCQSQRAGTEHLSAGGRWMRWEFQSITAATQSKTLHFVLTGKSSKCEHLNQQHCIKFWQFEAR